MVKEKPAIALAKTIVEHQRKIERLIINENFNFYVWEENEKGYIQTAFCEVGGCVADYLTFDSLDEAKRQATMMTIRGQQISTVSICSECEHDAVDDQECLICGSDKLPMYEEHPNWVKFCPACDHYVN